MQGDTPGGNPESDNENANSLLLEAAFNKVLQEPDSIIGSNSFQEHFP